MKLKKKDLVEIIDTNGELIGSENIPNVDANADTQAHGTTDTNAKIGQQPFRYDMLGRFGFTLMPFMEGVEENSQQKALLNDLTGLMHEKFSEIIEYYYRHPNLLKSDFRKSMEEGHGHDPKCEKKDVEWARKIVKVVEKHFENAFKEPENIDESKMVEDKFVDKKEDEMSTKGEDGEIKEKKLEKIAGLINKLEKKDIDKLINLLENKAITNEPHSLNNGFEKLYGGLIEKKGNLTTMTDFFNRAGLKKLMYGFDPNGFHNDGVTLFYYWWDGKLIGDDSDAFKSELLNWFNSKYNKKAEKAVPLYVGVTQQKESGTY